MATLTVYPVPSTTVSGIIHKLALTWDDAHDAAAGDSVEKDPSSGVIQCSYNGSNYQISRGFFLFDTSALPDGATISSAVLSLCSTGDGAYLNQDTTSLDIVSSNPAADNNLVTGDFDQVGSTSFGNITLASWTTSDGTYNDITLNASGIAAISKTGITKLGCRIKKDLDDSAVSGRNELYFYFSGSYLTDKDPKLVITYTITSAVKNTPNLLTLGVG